MKSSIKIWSAFAVCLAVVLFAMGWISRTALHLEREQQFAERRAALEENVRLALWRMDSTLHPIIGQESARPYSAYQPFVPTSQALTSSYAQVADPVLLPSPLLSGSSPYVRCYFQFDAHGKLSSPQVPPGEINKVIRENVDVTETQLTEAGRRLDELSHFIRRGDLLKSLPTPAEAPVVTNLAVNGTMNDVEQLQQENLPNGFPNPNYKDTQQSQSQPQPQQALVANSRRGSVAGQRELAANEYRIRAQNSANVGNNMLSNWTFPLETANVRVAALQPLWIEDHLLFARRVTIEDDELIQGVWLDWPQIRQSLLEDVRDLLPAAELEPIREEYPEEESRMLTTIPARIVAGPVPVEASEGWSPIQGSLGIAWLCTLAAAALGAVLLAAVLSLSERRAAFVSAVTHELRTPLTTFQLYTEMLDEGLVTDAEQRDEYLKTLRNESNRLGHLVENVLAYARIDRSRQTIHVDDCRLSELIDRVEPGLRQRAERGGMKLNVLPSEHDASITVRVDPSGVERILINLVDNACKYAEAAENRTIEISTSIRKSLIDIRVRDFGPGARPAEKNRLFRLFAKSARDAAGSKPGVGLGLALSRALARKQGGDLWIDDKVTEGACFVLSLPQTSG